MVTGRITTHVFLGVVQKESSIESSSAEKVSHKVKPWMQKVEMQKAV